MKKINFVMLLVLLVASFSFLFFPKSVSCDVSGDVAKQLNAAAGESGAGLGEARDPRVIATDIIRVILSLLGTIFLVLTIYAGFLWMTAGGNEDKVGKAKSLLFQGVIGLVIILSAYAITMFVVKVALGEWSSYSNVEYVETPAPIRCGEYGFPACP